MTKPILGGSIAEAVKDLQAVIKHTKSVYQLR